MRDSEARFSVVIPVHNEEAMLPKTLSSVYSLQPDEVFFCLDRCTDGTEDIVKRWADAYAKSTTTTLRRYTDSDGVGWQFRGAYLRRDAYNRVRNDTILNSAADLRLCQSIPRLLENIPRRYGLVSFHYYEYPWTIQCFERGLLCRIRPGFAGLLALSRRAWRHTEDIEDLKKIPRAEDTHLHFAIRSRYPVKHYHSYSLHLRPNETPLDHYNRGQATYALVTHKVLRVLIQSVVMFRPAKFCGFMHARSEDRRMSC